MALIKIQLKIDFRYQFVLQKNMNMGLGFKEILLIALVILVLFGARKIPQFMKGLGKGIRDFSNEKNKGKDELDEAEDQL